MTKQTAFAAVAASVMVGCASAALTQPSAQASRAAEHPRGQGFSEAAKVALSGQLRNSVSRGQTAGVVALVVDRDGVLYQGAAGMLDVALKVPMPVDANLQVISKFSEQDATHEGAPCKTADDHPASAHVRSGRCCGTLREWNPRHPSP